MTLAERLRAALTEERGEALVAGDFADLAAEPDEAMTAAAVLVAITDRPEPGVILTQRTETLRRHPGQVAFPGGRIDPGESVVEAALREAEEEIALPRGTVELVGMADRYRTGSGFDITPVIGVIPPGLALVPAEAEVASVFEVPLAFLLDPANHHAGFGVWRGAERQFVEIPWPDRRIWGATAAMIVNLSAAVAMAVILPDAAWRRRSGLVRLAAILGARADETRVVGGAVRDTLLGLPVADVDLATRHQPAAAMALLAAAGVKVVPTGLAHGTITAVVDGQPVEVTTLRRDVATDGRHAVVAFTDDWREDAGRRDFTMNALYADPASGAVFDYFGGLDDLAARRVRFIGDPLRRIAEDHLRILRFFRFHARFGEAIDADGLEACTARANDLMALSRERIAAELLKLLVAPAAVSVATLMVERGILAAVLPEIDAEGTARLAALAPREAAAGIAPDPIRRLAALVPAAAAEAIGARLKLSNAQRKRLVAATAGSGDEGMRALAYRAGPESAVDRLLLAGEDPRDIVGWLPPRLPLSGGALVARGLDKGPAVAAALRAVESRWIAEGFPDADRVAAIADQVLAATSSASAASASSGRA